MTEKPTCVWLVDGAPCGQDACGRRDAPNLCATHRAAQRCFDPACTGPDTCQRCITFREFNAKLDAEIVEDVTNPDASDWKQPLAVREANQLDEQLATIDVESLLANAQALRREAQLALVEADRRLALVEQLAREVHLARAGVAEQTASLA